MTTSKPKHKAGGPRETGRRNRKYAKLFQKLNTRLDDTSNTIVSQAIERLTEMFLKEEETRQKEIDRQHRLSLREKAQDKEQAQEPKEGPESAQAKKGSIYDEYLASPARYTGR